MPKVCFSSCFCLFFYYYFFILIMLMSLMHPPADNSLVAWSEFLKCFFRSKELLFSKCILYRKAGLSSAGRTDQTENFQWYLCYLYSYPWPLQSCFLFCWVCVLLLLFFGGWWAVFRTVIKPFLTRGLMTY